MVSQSDCDQIGNAVRTAREEAREKLGADYPYVTIKWSSQMTSSAGNASHKSGLIKLSKPIFFKAVEELGISKACEHIRTTVLHEIAHVASKDGHGWRWREYMHRLGLDPQKHRYHSLTAGLALNQAAQKWRVGDEVDFEHNGVLESGRIIGLNQKRASVQVYGYQRHWLVPYRLLQKA